jgi:hypothetical protein
MFAVAMLGGRVDSADGDHDRFRGQRVPALATIAANDLDRPPFRRLTPAGDASPV